MKICGIYKITNTITNDCYIGSSNDVKRRWAEHKKPSRWNKCPNNQLYQDMRKYGTDKFVFEVLEVLEVVEPEELKEAEQKFIETLKPTYNNYRAKGLDIERRKEYQKSDKYKKYKKEYNKEYQKTDKYKEHQKEYEKSDKRKKAKKEYNKEYHKTDKFKEYQKEYRQSEKYKEYQKEYNNQLCFYNGEILTLNALSKRFRRAGIEHPVLEAKKYLLVK